MKRKPDAGTPDAGAPDAGTPDAGRIADAGISDGRIPDAGQDASIPDAGPDAGQRKPDAGADTPTIASLSDAGHSPLGDAGAVVISASKDAGSTSPLDASIPAAPDAGVPAKPAPTWATASMSDYVPQGDHVAVTLRLDKLRGTEWADKVAAILAPMPDHRLIIGSRKVRFSDSFDMLHISTSNPADVAATTVACTGNLRDAALRGFLEHSDAKVQWKPVAAGALGTINSRFQHKSDPRVYMKTGPSQVALVLPKTLGQGAAPRAGDVDDLAAPAEVPTWLARVPELARISGTEGAPLAIVHVSALPASVSLPRGPTLSSPKVVSLFL